jgi:hypothetical protein
MAQLPLPRGIIAGVLKRTSASHDANSPSNALASFKSSVKLFGKPAVDRSQKIASLIALSLIAPQRCKARGGAHAKLRWRWLYAPVASDKHFLVKLVFAAP